MEVVLTIDNFDGQSQALIHLLTMLLVGKVLSIEDGGSSHDTHKFGLDQNMIFETDNLLS